MPQPFWGGKDAAVTYPPPAPRPRANAAVVITVAFAGLCIILALSITLFLLNRSERSAAAPTETTARPASPASATPSPSASAKVVTFEVTGTGVVGEIRWQVGYDQAATDEDARLPWKKPVTLSREAGDPAALPVSLIVDGDRNQALTCRIRFGDDVVDEQTSDRFVTCTSTL